MITRIGSIHNSFFVADIDIMSFKLLEISIYFGILFVEIILLLSALITWGVAIGNSSIKHSFCGVRVIIAHFIHMCRTVHSLSTKFNNIFTCTVNPGSDVGSCEHGCMLCVEKVFLFVSHKVAACMWLHVYL